MAKPEIEELRLPVKRGEYKTRLYRGASKNGLPSDFEDVIVLAPGIFGSGTLHFAASALAAEGHDVAVVSHSRTSIFHPNYDRSKNVHFTAKAATEATGKRGVILLGHSNGVQDIHHAAERSIRRQSQEPSNSELYIVTAVGAAAGSGLSDKLINGKNLAKEAASYVSNLTHHPSEELAVVSRSIANFARRPVSGLIEGIGALTCDIRPKAALFLGQVGVRNYCEGYLEDDGVIPLPDDRGGYYERPGTHLTPVIDREFFPELAEMLYTSADLTDHELLQYAEAA